MANFVACKNLSGNIVYINMDNVWALKQVPESEKASCYKGKDITALCIIGESEPVHVFGTANDLYLDACIRNNAVCT